MDSLRYWAEEMHVDGFRFDLAVRPRPPALRRRPAVELLHAHPGLAEPARVEADRRAVGRRRRAATRSATSRRAGPSGTAATATRCARFWRGEAGQHGRDRLPPHRLAATSTRRAAAAPRRASTSSPPTTASRCATSSATTTSTTRRTARTTATATTTSARGTAASKGETDDPGVNALRRAPAAQLARDAAAVAGHADAAGRRRARPHAARQQQRLLPGQRDVAGSTGSLDDEQRALLEFTRGARAHPPRPPGAAPRRSSSRAADPRHRRHATSPGSAPTAAAMTEEDWANPARAACSAMFLAGRGIDDVDAQGRPIVDDSFLLLVQREPRRRRLRAPLAARGRGRTGRCSSTRARDRPQERVAARRLHAARRPLAQAAARAHPGVPHRRRRPHRRADATACSSRRGFGFAEAAAIVAVPRRPRRRATSTRRRCMATAPGSTHGYDVVDHARLNPELGGEDGPRRADGRAAPRTAWGSSSTGCPTTWASRPATTSRGTDVLENGPASLHAELLRHRLAARPSARLRGHGAAPGPRRAVRRGARDGARSRSCSRTAGSACATTSTASRWRRGACCRSSSAAARATGLADGRPGAAGAREHPRGDRAPARPRRDRAASARRERAREKEVVKRRLARAARGLGPEVRGALAAQVEAAERRRRRRRRASTGSTRSCATRRTASPPGASPPRRSTTAASSTSTSWPRSAWRTRGSSSARTGCSSS